MLVVYLACTGALLVAGRERVPVSEMVLHAMLLGAIAIATWAPGVPAWLRHWAPIAALPFLYAELPALMAAAGNSQLMDARVIAWEQITFGAQPARAFAARWQSRVLSEVLHTSYLAYYPIIFSVPVALWVAKRRTEFAVAALALMATFVVCFACYVAFPVAGPRYFWSSPADGVSGPARAATLWLLENGSSRGTAFPSSHVAVATTQAILAVRYFDARGLIIGVLALGLSLGAVYGGFHYAIDVLAGALTGSVLTGCVLLATRRRGARVSTYAKATAPT